MASTVSTVPNYLRPYAPQPYFYITDSQSLSDHLAEIQNAPLFGIDSETTGRDPYRDRLRLIQIAVPDYPVLVIDLFKIPQSDREPLRQFLKSDALKIGHNLKFDWQFLALNRLGLSEPLFDTQLAYRVWTAGLKVSLKLGSIVEKLLNVKLDKRWQTSNFSATLNAEQLQYAANDAAILLDLYRILLTNLKRNRKLLRVARLEFRCIASTAQMELNGMRIDLNLWQQYGASLEQQRDAALDQVSQLQRPSDQLSLVPELTHTVNPNSPRQLLKALQAIGVPIQSTSEKELVPLTAEFPVIQALLNYRKLKKITTVFDTSLPKYIHPTTGRLHANWFQYGARSGRFSCRNPALQTIPRHQAARQCFVASPGHKIIKTDYSQFELRIVAKLSGDRRLRQAYRHEEDVHRLTASLITGKQLTEVTDEDRRLAKAVIFGLIYGMGAVRLQVYAEIKFGIHMTLDDAKLFSRRFFIAYPGIKQWHQQIQRSVYSRNTRESYTLFGRRRRWSGKPRLTELLNHPVQGLNADIIKLALIKLQKPLARLNAMLIGVVHDELIIECPAAVSDRVCQSVVRQMVKIAEPFLHPIPVVVDIMCADSWGGDLEPEVG